MSRHYLGRGENQQLCDISHHHNDDVTSKSEAWDDTVKLTAWHISPCSGISKIWFGKCSSFAGGREEIQFHVWSFIKGRKITRKHLLVSSITSGSQGLVQRDRLEMSEGKWSFKATLCPFWLHIQRQCCDIMLWWTCWWTFYCHITSAHYALSFELWFWSPPVPKGNVWLLLAVLGTTSRSLGTIYFKDILGFFSVSS